MQILANTQEARMQEAKELRTHIINYSKTRDTYAAYRKAGYSRKFLEAHREEITLHKAAKEAFDKLELKKIPKIAELNEEFNRLAKEKNAMYAQYRSERDQRAIRETQNSYQRYCGRIAANLLASYEDREECLNDTWLNTWYSIPPQRPESLKAYVAKITRNLALNRIKHDQAEKRSTGETDAFVSEADGYQESHYYTIDKTTGEGVTLKSLFAGTGTDYITEVSDEIKRQMKENHEKDSNKTYWLDEPLLGDQNFTSITDNTQFCLNADGHLVIVFAEGEVAPMSMGEQEFIMPESIWK